MKINYKYEVTLKDHKGTSHDVCVSSMNPMVNADVIETAKQRLYNQQGIARENLSLISFNELSNDDRTQSRV